MKEIIEEITDRIYSKSCNEIPKILGERKKHDVLQDIIVKDKDGYFIGRLDPDSKFFNVYAEIKDNQWFDSSYEIKWESLEGCWQFRYREPEFYDVIKTKSEYYLSILTLLVYTLVMVFFFKSLWRLI